MAKATEYGIMKAPDGFYFCKKTKTGMPSKDSRKITEQEIIAMFEDVLRRNKAETGKDVMTIWTKREPLMIAKLNPTLEECGIMTPRMKAAMAAKARQQAMMGSQQKGPRLTIPES